MNEKLIKKYGTSLSLEEINYFFDIAKPIINNKDFQRQKDFIQHGSFSTFDHTIYVAFRCYVSALRKKNYHLKEVIRAALLHDFCLYDWHILKGRKRFHGIRHPKIAIKNADKLFGLNKLEKSMINTHMWPLTFFRIPKHKESWLLCIIDKKQSYNEIKGDCGNVL